MKSSRNLNSDLTGIDALDFALSKLMMNTQTLTLGKIIEVNNNLLTVQSLINYKDVDGNGLTPPKTFNVLFGKMQGGIAGLIIEPAKDDLVLIGYCQRDISETKKTGRQSTPKSNRTHALEDAYVINCWNLQPPMIYVKITKDSIEIQAQNKPISINTSGNATVIANTTTINGNVVLGGAGGAKVLTENTVITAPNGACTISNPATKVTAL